jgi:hypothetical protein
VVYDARAFVRDETDGRLCVYTDDSSKVAPLAKELGLDLGVFTLEKGKIFAVFFNDRIKENLIQITLNKATGGVSADYADSGIELKLKAPDAGKKYSHLTAVVFSFEGQARKLGIRGMIPGLSEKK